jgi:hypothetical protein
MKFQVLLMLFGCLLMPLKAVCQVTVHLKITQTSSYCGGAAPPRELIEQLNTPSALAGKVIYLRKGKTNNLCKKPVMLKSDENGEITTSLDPGFYAVVDDTKNDNVYYNDLRKRFSEPVLNYGELDINCLDSWLETPQQVIEVVSKKTQFQINFHQPCSWNAIPCVQYNGPMPP